ncbi:ferritin-like domain-containing protein [Nakamurella sp. PAMC28650]|uniref:ferritin-like domain-containing protein n=1 Tax=Nakamurella sp. PAMC28650 TaxID=2762325 RepID=UPI00164D0E58|nr:ferritin-like domain-containing protein [Nakamurella sp. PAMC28650]QNK82038.1 ferritin-like domain-containing protein [Nakamurella sp. PAMC28650]
MSRSEFVRGEMASVPAPLALAALNNRWALASAADFASDIDVLNYALTLEYLESAFYTQGQAANLLSGTEKAYLDKIAADEAYHVTAITATIKQLGGTPVAAPGVNFGAAFASRTSYLTTSHTFENVGVGAYLGAAGYIKDKAVLQAAAGIFGVEARHAAVVGNLLGLKPEGGVYMGAFETGIAKATVLAGVAPFIVQMTPGNTPTGAANTGGGSASKDDNSGLFALGGAALLGAAGAAVYAAKHRAPESAE